MPAIVDLGVIREIDASCHRGGDAAPGTCVLDIGAGTGRVTIAPGGALRIDRCSIEY
jgi:ubiquinone/menaquinone biosynthesis C-methylase UbiE